MSRIRTIAATALLSVPASLLAGPYDYPGAGSENLTTYTFTASATGTVNAYFFGSSADYGSDIGLIVNNLSQGTFGLQDHAVTSVYGAMFNMGPVNAGDVLEFQLRVSTTDGSGPPPLTYSLYSTPSHNSDGANHIYSLPFATDGIIPNGTYIGFEDIAPITSGDRDYNDHQFVFENVGITTHSTPDGGSTLALVGLGLAGLGILRRKVA